MTDEEYFNAIGVNPSDYGFTFDTNGNVVNGDNSLLPYGTDLNWYLPNETFNPNTYYQTGPGEIDNSQWMIDTVNSGTFGQGGGLSDAQWWDMNGLGNPDDYGVKFDAYGNYISNPNDVLNQMVGGQYGDPNQVAQNDPWWKKVLNAVGGGSDTTSSLAKLGAGIGGAALQSSAANKASDAQAQAARYAAELQYKAQQEALGLAREQWMQNQANQAPWLAGGKASLGALLTGLGLGDGTAGPLQSGELTKSFGPADFQTDPGYAFRLAEGQKALERSASAKGGILTGGALKAASRYNQDMASQEYNNAFNRFNVNQTNKYNRFANTAGLGQVAANQLGQYGQNYANQAGNLMFNTAQGMGDMATQAANARASGYIAGGNIWGNLLGNIGNNISESSLLNQILRGY